MEFERKSFNRKGLNKREIPLADADSRKKSVRKTRFKWVISDDVVDEMLAELREKENVNHE